MEATKTRIRPLESKVSSSQKAVDYLRSQILSRHFAPGDRLPSIRELDDITGFGLHAVRQAINKLCSEGLLEVIPGSGTYTSKHLDAANGSAAERLIATIGIVAAFDDKEQSPSISHKQTLEGIFEQCTMQGLRPMLLPPYGCYSDAKQLVSMKKTGMVDGLIWLHPGEQDWPVVRELLDKKVPVVVTAHSHTVPFEIPCVEGDEIGAGVKIANYLLADQCRRIRILFSSPHLKRFHEGLQLGLLNALSGSDTSLVPEFDELSVSLTEPDFIENYLEYLQGFGQGEVVFMSYEWLGRCLFEKEPARTVEVLNRFKLVLSVSSRQLPQIEPLAREVDPYLMVYPLHKIGAHLVMKLDDLMHDKADNTATLLHIQTGRYQDLVPSGMAGGDGM